MHASSNTNEHPRTERLIEKCEDILFWNLKGSVSTGTEQFLESVHKQMVKYPERYPTVKQALVIEEIYEAALDEMAREGRYAFYMLPLRHRGTPATNEPDTIACPPGRPVKLGIHSQSE